MRESMRHSNYGNNFGCPLEAAIEAIGGKWKGIILYHLIDGVKRFNELRRLMPSVTQRMLTKQLRELEDDGIILRHVYAQVPPKVEYSFTPFGSTLIPILKDMEQWGKVFVARLDEIRDQQGS